ncbi:NACHT domain-containing protein [Crossiella sp. CA-258035]|uniref:NACHT domain-containing protein n=1 Tax=Crossiella sp. CA-258035 TaxID=2981138 RepID=UPI0024BD2631|nr:NACHT domain-containing protein [Crossiella sp. CA-258035]WHT22978.1 NACHT domain-containing protein [Crossiella sp. CA-258035]
MGVLATAAVKLGETLVKLACEAATGSKAAGEVAGGLTAVLGGHGVGKLDQRRARRQLETVADTVAGRVMTRYGAEFRGLDEESRAVVVEAVAEAFQALPPLTELVLAASCRPERLAARVRQLTGDLLRGRYFGRAETDLYELLLDTACAEVTQICQGLHGLANLAVPEVLRQLSGLAEEVRAAPVRALAAATEAGEARFARTYREFVADELAEADLDCDRLTRTSRRYPLAAAYLARSVHWQGSPVAVTALLSHSRLLLTGPCGAGKTTLLRWLFTGIARRGLAGFEHLVPFYLPLHHYTDRTPRLDDLITALGQDIAAEMPSGWVQRQLREGDSLVLLNGLDEVPSAHRRVVLDWIEKLCAKFSRATVVLASRPDPTLPGWAAGAGFTVAELAPMNPAEAHQFIQRWHAAVLVRLVDPAERAWVVKCERRLLDALAGCHALRVLAANPLTCALMCALHRDRLVRLPDSWVDLLRMITEILVDERDRVRGIVDELPAPREERLRVLADLAYWMSSQDITRAKPAELLDRVAHASGTQLASTDPARLVRGLAERTGLVRLDAEGGLTFPSPVLRDYLVSREVVAGNYVRALARAAHRLDLHQLVLMVAAQLTGDRAAELVATLSREAAENSACSARQLLVNACEYRPGPELSEDALAQLAIEHPAVLVDALAREPLERAVEVARLASAIQHWEALPLLARLARDGGPEVAEALRPDSRWFDPVDLRFFLPGLREDAVADKVPGGGAGD